MAKQKAVIWGASGHALVVFDIIKLCADYQVVGFLDDINLKRHHTEFCSLPILGGKEQLGILLDQGIKNIILGFGECQARLTLSRLVCSRGFNLIRAIHPSAVIAKDAVIGEGPVVAAGAVINPSARIGKNVIINTAASVDHECVIADGAHIGPGVHLGGRVEIGQAAWIGIGAAVKDRVKIGKNSLVGAGSVVLKDVPAKAVVFGVPAKAKRRLNR